MTVAADTLTGSPPNVERVVGQVRRVVGQPTAHKRTKTPSELLDRKSLDGRTREARRYDSIVAGIRSDLGGLENMSTLQVSLSESYALAQIVFDDLGARILRGEEVDRSAFASSISSLVRLARQLGTRRIAKDVGPSLSDILREEAKP
jgi:hypothetical protein